jgi:hypothetical protein
MRYICLIYDDEAAFAKLSEAQQGGVFQEYMAFTADIVKSGHHRAGDPLQPAQTATTIRMKDGKVVTTDGPFVETKEQLGGYYLIEAKDLDDALSIAKRIPSVRHGGAIEVRPLMEIPGRQ